MNRRMDPLHGGRLAAMLALLLMPVAAWGQDGESTVVIGRIIEPNAAVHAGAGDSYYVVGHLDADTIVTIEDRYFEWYKIVPPQGVFSFIEKARVDVAADGSAGTVNQDRTAIRAAGIEGQHYRRQLDLHKGDPVRIVDEQGEFYRITPPDHAYVYVRTNAVKREQFEPAQVQPPAQPTATAAPATTQAPAAATSTPAATASTPAAATPAASSSSAPSGFLPPRPADTAMATTATPPAPEQTTTSQPEPPAQPEPAAAPQPATVAEAEPAAAPAEAAPEPAVQTAAAEAMPQPEPAVEAEAQPTVVEAPPPAQPETPTVAVAAIATEAETPAQPEAEPTKAFDQLSFEQLEQVMAATAGQPLEQQPIDELLAAYEQMYQNADLDPQQRRQVLLQIIKLRRNAALAVTLREISQVRQSINAAPSRVDAYAQSLENAGAMQYDAVGQLMASSVYDGINLPRLYRVVSPSMRTIVYVRPSDAIDTSTMLGRIVGVAGPSRYDSALKMRVLEAREIDLLRAQPSGEAAATE